MNLRVSSTVPPTPIFPQMRQIHRLLVEPQSAHLLNHGEDEGPGFEKGTERRMVDLCEMTSGGMKEGFENICRLDIGCLPTC